MRVHLCRRAWLQNGIAFLVCSHVSCCSFSRGKDAWDHDFKSQQSAETKETLPKPYLIKQTHTYTHTKTHTQKQNNICLKKKKVFYSQIFLLHNWNSLCMKQNMCLLSNMGQIKHKTINGQSLQIGPIKVRQNKKACVVKHEQRGVGGWSHGRRQQVGQIARQREVVKRY